MGPRSRIEIPPPLPRSEGGNLASIRAKFCGLAATRPGADKERGAALLAAEQLGIGRRVQCELKPEELDKAGRHEDNGNVAICLQSKLSAELPPSPVISLDAAGQLP